MPKKLNYKLSESELAAIEAFQKSGSNAQERLRATGIRLLHLGSPPAEVAELLNVSVATVYNWHERWRKGEIDGLRDEPRSGRPQVATAEYCARLEAVIETDPQALGYGFTLWTINRLLAHLAKVTGRTMSDETFREVLQRTGYVYRRPKHELKALQNAEARAEAEALLATQKKMPTPARANYSLWTKQP